MLKQGPKQLKDRAVRLVLDHRNDYESKTKAIGLFSERLDISHEFIAPISGLCRCGPP